MEFLMDHPEVEKQYQHIVRTIPAMQNGLTANSLVKRGINYERIYGVSFVDLKQEAGRYEKNHLLALKLWNKKWRETMIMATLLDEADKVSEEQMDFWIKSAENSEIVEHAVNNLFCSTKYAFVKALEWCRGKKFLVKYSGIHMMGRLALTNEKAIDEMFESFFEVLTPLSKDPALYLVLYRSLCQLARRSHLLYEQCVSFANELKDDEVISAQNLGHELIEELSSPVFIDLIQNKS